MALKNQKLKGQRKKPLKERSAGAIMEEIRGKGLRHQMFLVYKERSWEIQGRRYRGIRGEPVGGGKN